MDMQGKSWLPTTDGGTLKRVEKDRCALFRLEGTSLLHVWFFCFLLAITTAYMAFVEATYASESSRRDAVCSEIVLKLFLDLGLW